MTDINNIYKVQKELFKTGITKDFDFRINKLKLLKYAIKKYENDIIDAINKDLNKPSFEAYTTEVGILYESINYMIKNIKKWGKRKRVKTPLNFIGAKSYIYKEPFGSVLIIGPYNYPFQLVMEPLIGAIAAGNCAVIKPSEFTIHTSKIIEKIIDETFDQNFIAVFNGEKEVTSTLIKSNPDYIFFTGSVRVGKIIMKAASENLIPVTLELGGKSPCIVDKTANIDTAAKRIVWGKFLNTGQTCIAPDYIYVDASIKDEFISKLKHYVTEFYTDNPLLSGDYGRIINETHTKRISDLIDKDKVVHGGTFNIEERYIEPTILNNVTWEDEVMQDEIFGPILPILEFSNISDVIDTISSKPKPLALYLFSENKNINDKVINQLDFGGGCINETIMHVATPHIPFGGVGTSGMGSYHGKYSFDTFSRNKSVMKRTTKFGLDVIFPPYNTKKEKMVRKLLK